LMGKPSSRSCKSRNTKISKKKQKKMKKIKRIQIKKRIKYCPSSLFIKQRALPEGKTRWGAKKQK